MGVYACVDFGDLGRLFLALGGRADGFSSCFSATLHPFVYPHAGMRPAVNCGVFVSFEVSGTILLLCIRQVFVGWRRKRSAELELAAGAMADAAAIEH